MLRWLRPEPIISLWGKLRREEDLMLEHSSGQKPHSPAQVKPIIPFLV